MYPSKGRINGTRKLNYDIRNYEKRYPNYTTANA